MPLQMAVKWLNLPRGTKYLTLFGQSINPTVASETLQGMFLVNNSLNTQCRAVKPPAIDFY